LGGLSSIQNQASSEKRSSPRANIGTGAREATQKVRLVAVVTSHWLVTHIKHYATQMYVSKDLSKINYGQVPGPGTYQIHNTVGNAQSSQRTTKIGSAQKCQADTEQKQRVPKEQERLLFGNNSPGPVYYPTVNNITPGPNALPAGLETKVLVLASIHIASALSFLTNHTGNIRKRRQVSSICRGEGNSGCAWSRPVLWARLLAGLPKQRQDGSRVWVRHFNPLSPAKGDPVQIAR
jgi:hypothetical protein